MMRKAKIGILGAGTIFPAHVRGYKRWTDLGEVVAVADPNPETHKGIREAFGENITICKNYHELLAMGDVEAVDNILPPFMHMPSTIAAAKAGKHVLVEKVMARNIYECDRMISACEEAGVSLVVCHDRRYGSEWRALKNIVDSGVLGKTFYWKLEHNQDVALPKDHWRLVRDGIGGGAINVCLSPA